jgi:signal transduction histidine kinase
VLRATEQERVRLAADLYDGPVQELTALRYGLTRARRSRGSRPCPADRTMPAPERARGGLVAVGIIARPGW